MANSSEKASSAMASAASAPAAAAAVTERLASLELDASAAATRRGKVSVAVKQVLAAELLQEKLPPRLVLF